jgi:hypothetical protein
MDQMHASSDNVVRKGRRVRIASVDEVISLACLQARLKVLRECHLETSV